MKFNRSFFIMLFSIIVLLSLPTSIFAAKSHYFEKEKEFDSGLYIHSYFTQDGYLLVTKQDSTYNQQAQLERVDPNGKVVQTVTVKNNSSIHQFVHNERQFFLLYNTAGNMLYDEQLQKIYTFPKGPYEVRDTYGQIVEFYNWSLDEYVFLNMDTFKQVSELDAAVLNYAVEIRSSNKAYILKKTVTGNQTEALEISNLKQVMPTNFQRFDTEYTDVEVIQHNGQFLLFITSNNSLPESIQPGILIVSAKGQAVKYIPTPGDVYYSSIIHDRLFVYTDDEMIHAVNLETGTLKLIGESGWVFEADNGRYIYDYADSLYRIYDRNDNVLYETTLPLEIDGLTWSYPFDLIGSYITLQNNDFVTRYSVYDLNTKKIVYGPMELTSWFKPAGDNQILVQQHVNGKEIMYVDTLGQSGIQLKDANLEAVIRKAINKPTGDITKADAEKLEKLYTGPELIESLEGLEHFTNLKELYVIGNKLKDITPLQHLTKLEILDVSNNFITSLAPLEKLTKLKRVDAEGNALTSASGLNNLLSLKYLNLSDNTIQDLSPLESLKGLFGLFLSNNALGGDRDARTIASTRVNNVLAPLQGMSQLETLDLSDNALTSLNGVEKLTSLQTLVISNNALTDISNVNALSRLVKVDAANNSLVAINRLSSKSLQMLDLSGNDIASVVALSKLPQLATLNVKANPVQDLQTVADFPALTQVTVDADIENPLVNQIAYSEWPAKFTTDRFKAWHIKLSIALNTESLNERNVFVKDSKGNIVPTRVDYNSSSQEIIVQPPMKGYTPGETYTLYIQNVTSTKGLSLKNAVRMSFDVVANDTRTTLSLDGPSFGITDAAATIINVGKSIRTLSKIADDSIFYMRFLREENRRDGSAQIIWNLMKENIDPLTLSNCEVKMQQFASCINALAEEDIRIAPVDVPNYLAMLYEESLNLTKVLYPSTETAIDLFVPNPVTSIMETNKEKLTDYQKRRDEAIFQYANEKFLLIFDKNPLQIEGESTLKVDEQHQYKALANGSLGEQAVEKLNVANNLDSFWVVEDPSVLSISPNGTVTAKKAGKSKIFVMYGGKPAHKTIKVK